VSPLDLSFDYKDRLSVPLESQATNRVRGHSLTGEWSFTDNLAAKYIGGYREYHQNAGGNQVWGAGEFIDDVVPPAGVGGTFGGVWTPLFALRDEKQHQQSHELQLIGTTERFDWIGGVFYFEETGAVDAPILLFKSIGPVNTISVAGFDYFVGQKTEVNNRSSAAYAHGTWHVADFDLSAGVRYTRDKRSELVVAAGLIGAVLPGNQEFDYSGNHTDYDASITYKISPSSNVYLKYATGYVSGGTLFGSRFDPDEMKAYELGYKADLFDNRLRLNTAVFRQDRSDVQIEGFTSVGYFMGKGRDIKAEGVELEVTYVPLDGLSIDASYGYTNVDSSGQLRTFQPKQTAFLGAQYDFVPFANGIQPKFRVDASWRDDVHRLACPAGQDQIPASDVCVGTPDFVLDERATIKASTILSARLTLAEIRVGNAMSGQVALWGRNLLDEDELQYNFTLGGPTLTSTFIRPRTYGMDFSFEF
jgi:iron complex outermembrane receptor protein